MKENKFSKKFSLNKITVANLSDNEQSRVLGGCVLTYCKASGSAVYYSSTVYFGNTTAVILPNDPRYWPCYVGPDTDNIIK